MMRIVLLLACLCVAFATMKPLGHVLWRDFAANGKDSGVLAATGYSSGVLDALWHGYGRKIQKGLNELAEPVNLTLEYLSAYTFLALAYIHLYPRWNRHSGQTLHTKTTGRITEKKLYKILIPIILVASMTVTDQVNWSDRLDPYNHGTHFMKQRFTTIFDGTNIDVSNIRSDKRLARIMYCSGKYDHCW